MSAAPIECRWGIMGMGWIANMFIFDLHKSSNRTDSKIKHTITAVASSTVEKAQKILDTAAPGVKPVILTSYEELVRRSDVDVIYVATPHGLHYDHVKLCFENGKNVLCEKAFTINAKQAKELITLAKAKNLFLMEAMWTRFIPLMYDLQEKIFKDKIIGTPKRLFCDFGIPMDVDNSPADSRNKDPKMGAGPLLDIGIYPLTWARMLLQEHPDNKNEEPKVTADMILRSSGIDEQTSVILTYKSLGATAIATCSTSSKHRRDFLLLEGSNGDFITISEHGPSVPIAYTHNKPDGTKQEHSFRSPEGYRGFIHEADAVARDLAAGKKEDDRMPLGETLKVMELMDEIRRQGGLVYPHDLE